MGGLLHSKLEKVADLERLLRRSHDVRIADPDVPQITLSSQTLTFLMCSEKEGKLDDSEQDCFQQIGA